MGTTAEPIIRHHLEDEMLMLYAAGRLSEGWGVAVATHLALCPSCRGRVGVYEAIGGHFLDNEEPVEDDDAVAESWSRLRSRIENEEFPNVVTLRRPAGDRLLPQPLRSYVDRAGGLKWKTLGTGGAAQMIVSLASTQDAFALAKLNNQQHELSLQKQALGDDLVALNSPQALATRADAMGLVVAGAASYLRLSDGAVLGAGDAASWVSTVAPNGPTKVGNALLAPPPAASTETPADGAACPP